MVKLERLFPIYVLALMVVALVFVSCGDDTPDEPVDPLADAVLAISATTAEVGAEGELSDPIDVTNSGNSAALSWSVSSTSAWVTFSSTSGTTPSDFQIGGETNSTGAARTATASVTALHLDQAPLTITITQPTTAAAFCVSETEWIAAALGEESPYIYLENCGNANALDWEATEDADWLTLSPTSGSTRDSITITADPNNTGTVREAYVIVTEVGGDPDTILVTQPAVVSPASLGNDWGGSAEDVFVYNDYAFVADGHGALVIFDLTQTLSPTTELDILATFTTAGYAPAVHAFGDYAFVAEGADGVEIVDVSDPATPVLAGSIATTGNATDVYVRYGDTAYVAEDSEGLYMYDISDVGTVTEAGNCPTDGYAVGVHVSGSYAYVADGSDGLVIVNTETAGSPVAVGSFPDATQAERVAVVGDQAYVVDMANGLYIVDASDPANPTLVGFYEEAFIQGVSVSGDYAFIAALAVGLLVIDISDPANPVLVGSYDTDGEAYAVSIYGDLAVVADGVGGVAVLRLEL